MPEPAVSRRQGPLAILNKMIAMESQAIYVRVATAGKVQSTAALWQRDDKHGWCGFFHADMFV